MLEFTKPKNKTKKINNLKNPPQSSFLISLTQRKNISFTMVQLISSSNYNISSKLTSDILENFFYQKQSILIIIKSRKTAYNLKTDSHPPK